MPIIFYGVLKTDVKLKVSGTFCKPDGAFQFARIRGFISTCQNQSLHILNSHNALVGNPCLINKNNQITFGHFQMKVSFLDIL